MLKLLNGFYEMNNAKVTHVIVNNMGGITSLIKNLIQYRGSGALEQELFVLNIKGNNNTKADFSELSNCSIRYFSLDPKENWYQTYKRMAKCVGNNDGIIVSNDVFDLIMASRFNLNKKIVQIVHDVYNFRLSFQFEQYIDAFICHSEFIYDLLCQFFPQRRKDIHLRYYGIPLADVDRKSRLHGNVLKLVFLGRHDKAKGVYDLYEINNILKEKGVQVNWTILGKGPETEELQQQWSLESNVKFETPTNKFLYQIIREQDVFVFPTKFEGFPVALVEAMSLGCVPVVSNLPGGIREIVTNQTGCRCELDNVAAFADAITNLHTNRNELEEKSLNGFLISRSRHNASIQMSAYQEIFNEVVKSSQPPRHHGRKVTIGSRLDKRWIPNYVTKLLRSI